MKLNEWHDKIQLRNAEVFAGNKHTKATAALAVISELGEMANAVVGLMGCERRKAHLTRSDVLDGIGDASVYVSVLARLCGVDDMEAAYKSAPEVPQDTISPEEYALVLSSGTSKLAMHLACVEGYSRDDNAEIVGRCLRGLEYAARLFGCSDFGKLLADVYNHVSERSGSIYRVDP